MLVVLGPQIFVMYMIPTGIITQKQLFATFDVNDETNLTSSLQTLECWIAEIRSWRAKNMLKLNDDKSGVLYIASPHYLKSIKTQGINIGEMCIKPNNMTNFYEWMIM